MSEIILSITSVCILFICIYFNLSLIKVFILFGLNILGIIGSFAYYSMQQIVGITSAPPAAYGLLYTYKSIIVFIVCVVVFIIKRYLDFKKV